MRKNLTVVLGVVSLICLGTITNCEGGFGDWFSKLFGYNPAQEKKIVLNVDDVAADPAAYKGTITVKGVVYSMNTSQKLFTAFLGSGRAGGGLNLTISLLCLILALFVSFLSALFPAYQATKLTPVEAMRYE